MLTLTTKQFGDACEHLIMAKLGFTGILTAKMPDCWPCYDLIAETAAWPTRISLKGLRYGSGQQVGWWQFKPNGFDWLALLRVNEVTRAIAMYIVPSEKAIELSNGPDESGARRLRCSHKELERYRNNSRLEK